MNIKKAKLPRITLKKVKSLINNELLLIRYNYIEMFNYYCSVLSLLIMCAGILINISILKHTVKEEEDNKLGLIHFDNRRFWLVNYLYNKECVFSIAADLCKFIPLGMSEQGSTSGADN